MDTTKKTIFPGATIGEKISNELQDLFIKAEFRKEFIAMAIYAVILFGVTFFALTESKLPVNNYSIIPAFVALGAYWYFSDFSKRKKLFAKKTQFIIDSFFYAVLMYKIVVLTGGQDSPVRFPLYFLTAISAPLYGSMLQVVLFLIVIAVIQIYFYLSKYGYSFELIFTILEGLTFISAAIFVKISLNTAQAKTEEQKILNLELDAKLEETTVALERIQIANDEMEKLRKEKTKLEKNCNRA